MKWNPFMSPPNLEAAIGELEYFGKVAWVVIIIHRFPLDSKPYLLKPFSTQSKKENVAFAFPVEFYNKGSVCN